MALENKRTSGRARLMGSMCCRPANSRATVVSSRVCDSLPWVINPCAAAKCSPRRMRECGSVVEYLNDEAILQHELDGHRGRCYPGD